MYILSIAVLCGCLHLATSVPAQCEKAEIQTCGDKYKKAVRDGLGHCGRLQVMMDCLATNNPQCVGEVITSFRFWMLQMGLMDAIMEKCKHLETDVLKTLVMATIKNPKKYMDSVKSDPNVPCARQSHDKCVKEYIDDLRDKKVKLCPAIDNLNACYEAEKKNCGAKILKDFAQILEKVAKRVTRILEKHVPHICTNV